MDRRRAAGEFDTNPGFQRREVWDNNKKSALIESILLNVPIPLIYTLEDETKDKDIEMVIDGKQRSSSIFSFINNHFKLSGLKILPEYNGLYFRDLEKRVQQNIEKFNLSVVTIKSDSDKEAKFQIFDRLNSGSVTLNPQEIRNSIYQGPYNDMILKSGENPLFLQLMFNGKMSSRMHDIELATRFFAFEKEGYTKYPGNLKTFLNNHLDSRKQYFNSLRTEELTKELKDLEKRFKDCLNLATEIFGDQVFKSCNIDENNKILWNRNKTVFELVMWGFTLYDKRDYMKNKDLIRESFIKLMLEDEKILPKDGVMQSGNVKYRFSAWQLMLQEIIGSYDKEPRRFSYALKEELFNQNQTCSYCNQKIHTLDTAEVDHDEPYWKGGSTVPENARLLHRLCNREKSGK